MCQTLLYILYILCHLTLTLSPRDTVTVTVILKKGRQDTKSLSNWPKEGDAANRWWDQKEQTFHLHRCIHTQPTAKRSVIITWHIKKGLCPSGPSTADSDALIGSFVRQRDLLNIPAHTGRFSGVRKQKHLWLLWKHDPVEKQWFHYLFWSLHPKEHHKENKPWPGPSVG